MLPKDHHVRRTVFSKYILVFPDLEMPEALMALKPTMSEQKNQKPIFAYSFSSDPPEGELLLCVTTLMGLVLGRGILGSASKLSLFSLGNVIEEESLNNELNPEPLCSSLNIIY